MCVRNYRSVLCLVLFYLKKPCLSKVFGFIIYICPSSGVGLSLTFFKKFILIADLKAVFAQYYIIILWFCNTLMKSIGGGGGGTLFLFKGIQIEMEVTDVWLSIADMFFFILCKHWHHLTWQSVPNVRKCPQCLASWTSFSYLCVLSLFR